MVSFSAGVFAVFGSIVGGSLLGQTGLTIGAVLAGTIGVILAGLISHKAGWVQASELRPAIIGGAIGFWIASPVAAYGSMTFNNPIVPVLSVALVGFGFLLGARLAQR